MNGLWFATMRVSMWAAMAWALTSPGPRWLQACCNFLFLALAAFEAVDAERRSLNKAPEWTHIEPSLIPFMISVWKQKDD